MLLKELTMPYTDVRELTMPYVDLRGVDLQNVLITNLIGNGKEIKSAQFLKWPITWTKTDLAVGCKQYSIEEWFKFSDEDINKMDVDALSFWIKHRDLIKRMIEESL